MLEVYSAGNAVEMLNFLQKLFALHCKNAKFLGKCRMCKRKSNRLASKVIETVYRLPNALITEKQIWPSNLFVRCIERVLKKHMRFAVTSFVEVVTYNFIGPW